MESSIPEAISQIVKYSRLGEKIIAAAAALVPVVESVKSVYALDFELEPELRAVLAHIDAAMEGLDGAFKFVDARFDVFRGEAFASEAT